MANSSGAVIQAVDAGFFTAPPKAHPSRVYVVSYRDGHLRSFSGVPSAGDRRSSKFCYIVDTSEQHVTTTCTVTSADDAYAFSVELSAAWRVTDPEAAVRADLSDGSSLVLGSLQDIVWQVGRRFQPDRAADAESAVRTRLARETPLAAGITMLRGAARFRADAAVTSARVDRDTAAHQGDLELQRMALLRDMFDGSEAGALMLHLLKHPDDTGSVLATLKGNRDQDQALRLALLDRDRQHYLAMLDRALDNNLITDADAQPLRDLLFGQPTGGGLTGSVAMVPIASRPPLALPHGVSASEPAPAAWPAVTHGYVVEDVTATGPATSPPPPRGSVAEDADPDSAAAAGPASGSAPGGVRTWKPLKKPGQGPA